MLQAKKDSEDMYDSECNLGSHVPWKEVPGAGGKLPLLRPTPSSNDGPDRQQREANKVARAKTKVSKRSQSMELLGLIVFFLVVHLFFPNCFSFSFFICFSSCQFVFFFRTRSPSPPHAAAARGVRDLSPLPPPDSPPPPSAKSEVVAPRYRSRFFSDFFFAFSFSVFNSFHVISSFLRAIFFQSETGAGAGASGPAREESVVSVPSKVAQRSRSPRRRRRSGREAAFNMFFSCFVEAFFSLFLFFSFIHLFVQHQHLGEGSRRGDQAEQRAHEAGEGAGAQEERVAGHGRP